MYKKSLKDNHRDDRNDECHEIELLDMDHRPFESTIVVLTSIKRGVTSEKKFQHVRFSRLVAVTCVPVRIVVIVFVCSVMPVRHF